MPTHERQQIREAVVAALTGETAAEGRVSKSRLGPQRSDALPAISVYTDDETTDPASAKSAPRELKRTVRVAIEAWASIPASGALDDVLDALCLEIETAMDADVNLDRTAFTAFLEDTQIGMKMDGDRPMGCARLVYSIDYHTALRVTDSTDIFDTANVRFSLGGEQAELDQAVDNVTDINQE